MMYAHVSIPAADCGSTVLIETQIEIEKSPDEVFEFCSTSENLARFSGSQAIPWSENGSTIIRAGHVYAFHDRFLGLLPVLWVVYIKSYIPGREFAAVQLRGPFRHFRHTQRCEPSRRGTLYTDRIEYQSRFGKLADRTVIKTAVEHLFQRRLSRMKNLLETPFWYTSDIALEWKYWPSSGGR